jgi:integrase
MLNVKQIESARRPTVLNDGQGLRLEIGKSLNKKWIFRFTMNGKRRDMGLGRFPDVTLRQARSLRDEARQLVGQDIDPIEARRLQRAEQKVTFEFAVEKFIESKQSEWKNYKHRQQWQNTLNTYAIPKLGKMPVKDIVVQDVLSVVEPIWLDKTETAKRVRGRIEKVLGWSIAMGHRVDHNPAIWSGLLENLLPSPAKIAPPIHHKAMPLDQMHEFYDWLRQEKSISAKALQFLLLTVGRTGQVIGTQWNEISLEESIWSIPATRMKSRIAHDVPLSLEAVALLHELPRLADNAFLFPGLKPNCSINSNSMRLFLRKKMPNLSGTVHGFRSTFRDWAEEQNKWGSRAIEACLAHTNKNKVEAAYLRSDLIAQRRAILESWARALSSS